MSSSNKRVEYYREVNFDKDKTFVLSYYRRHQFENPYQTHNLRPTNATYEEITDTSKNRTYMMDGALMSFNIEMSLIEILFECAINGINIDFIDIYERDNNKPSRWSDDYKIVKIIDCHKENVEEMFEAIEAPPFYIAKNKKPKDKFKFLIVDRVKQNLDIKTLRGEYEDKAVVSKMLNLKDAKDFCKMLNDEKGYKNKNEQ